MKKKVLALLLSLVMVLSLVPALAFANDDTDPYVEDPFGDPVVHTNTHTVVHHAAVSSTCKDKGNIEYWYCEDCNAFFTDEACTNEVNEDSVLLPLSTTHTTQLQNAQAATCTEAGYTGDEVCTVCGQTITTGSVIPKAAHTLTHHAAVAATETSEGNTEYWECSVCHKYFSDANGETEIAENSWVIPVVTQPSEPTEPTEPSSGNENDPTGDDIFGHLPSHHVTSHAANASTCTVAGNSAYWYCQECEAYFSDAECTNVIKENSWVLPLADHVTELEGAVAATCTQNGYSGDEVCTVCGQTITEGHEIVAAGHKMVHTTATEATCTTAGNSEYYYCTTCQKYFSDANGENEIAENSWVIAAPGHSMTHHAAVAATETSEGNTEYWECSVCHKYFSDANGETEIAENSWIIPVVTTQGPYSNEGDNDPTGHDIFGEDHSTHNVIAHPAVASTCIAQGNSAYWYCEDCNKYYSDADCSVEIEENSWILPYGDHNTELQGAVAATCTQDGYSGDEVCTVCGQTITTGHVITAPGHAMVKVDAKPATCGTAGNTDYYYCTTCHKYFSDANGENEIAENSWVIAAPGHTLTPHAAVAATCTTAGNSAYWECTSCHKYFSDANGKNEIAENSWVIPASHTLVAHAAVAATCTTAGNSAYWECSVCHKYFSDADAKTEIAANSWVIPASHTLVAHTAVAATCQAEGNSAYWECSVCHKYFSDANGKTEIAANSWVTPKAAHTLVSHAAVAATCTTAGNSAYWECSVCHKYFADADAKTEISANSWVIPAAHKLTHHAAVAATCTTAGNSEYWECSVCHKYFADADAKTEISANSWVIPAAHTLVSHAAVAATCTTAGNSAYWECSVCHKYFADADAKTEIAANSWVIPASHTMLYHEGTQSTCKAQGNNPYYECTVCHKYFTDEQGNDEVAENSWVLPLAAHSLEAVAEKPATCTAEGNSAYWICNVCGKFFSDANGENEIAENAWVTAPIGHNFVQTGYKAATVDKTGLITYTCSNCGEIKTVVIAKLDESKPLSPANAPTLAQAEKIIYATKGDEAPAGSLYNLLQLRATKATKNSLTLKWTKVKGATGYIIYGSPCGGKYKKFKSVKGSKTSLTLKKLKKGKYYKFFIVATTKYEGATKVIATSKTIHFATKGGKVGNYKAVKLTNVKKNKVSVKKGKTFKIKAKSIVQSKKLKVKKHRTLRYESTNSKVAKVDKNGKITAKKKGTCFVYVYDQSGNFAKIKVTVK